MRGSDAIVVAGEPAVNRWTAWLENPRWARTIVFALLATQAGLLAYSATRHSPTHLEPASLVAGISHWQHGRFDLYRVNPPLVRMVAALPVLTVGCNTDWRHFTSGPGSRAEFPVGEDFVRANGSASIPLFFYARWACIPFSLIGSYFAYRWAGDLYGPSAGMLAITLYVFDPTVLAHGELITPDAACTSFGVMAGYTFWNWLKQPTWQRVIIAGASLGVAQLSKTTSLILFPVWASLWITWRCTRQTQTGPQRQSHCESSSPATRCSRTAPPAIQLLSIFTLAVYAINLGYCFDGTLTKIKHFTFVSSALTGNDSPGAIGNQFAGSPIGELPIPIPAQFLLGIDSQKKDFERYGHPSYLRGEWKVGGWWHYYIYGLLVKTPVGTLFVLAYSVLHRCMNRTSPAHLKDELVLLAPAFAILTMVSSQTAFNTHFRYVLPAIGFFIIFAAQAATVSTRLDLRSHTEARRAGLMIGPASCTIRALTTFSVISALACYPNHLSYFNELAGGSTSGWMHMVGSSYDYGQNILDIARWEKNRGAKCKRYIGAYSDATHLAASRLFVQQSARLPELDTVVTPANPRSMAIFRTHGADPICHTYRLIKDPASTQRLGGKGIQ